jgi:hypothetical protein
VAEWLRSGLQSRVHRFDSGRRLSLTDDPNPVSRLTDAVGRSGARLECPSCGHSGWQAFEHPVVLPAASPAGEGLGALALACSRCGFVRLHAAQILDRYLDPRSDV